MSPEQASDTVGAPGGVAIVTDTTTYLPEEMFARHAIQRVSLYVGWGGELVPERDYTDLDAFYAKLAASPQLPTTSQPSVGDFLEVYRPLVETGRDVVSVHIAEGLSGTCQSAREAARLLAEENQPGAVHVHDGQTGAGGLGMLVLAAAGLAEQGTGAEDIGAEEVSVAPPDADLRGSVEDCLDARAGRADSGGIIERAADEAHALGLEIGRGGPPEDRDAAALCQ